MNNGANESAGGSQPQKTMHIMVDEINVDKLIDVDDVTPWVEEKDRRITKLATFVIGVSASASCLSLLAKTFCPSLRTGDTINWETDILTLSLVASLSFVMGTSSK